MSHQPDFHSYANLPTDEVKDIGSLAPGETVNLKTQDEVDPDTPPSLEEFVCLHGWVVIWPKQPSQYKGVIKLPAGATLDDKKSDEGTVLVAGDQCISVKAGDEVHYWKHAGSWQLIDGKEVRVLKETEIYLVKKPTNVDAQTEEAT